MVIQRKAVVTSQIPTGVEVSLKIGRCFLYKLKILIIVTALGSSVASAEEWVSASSSEIVVVPEIDATNIGNGEFDDLGSTRETSTPALEGVQYTNDVSDEALIKRYKGKDPTLGSVALGIPAAGFLWNGVQMRSNEVMNVGDPQRAWATKETADYLQAVGTAVQDAFPGTKLAIGHIAWPSGGRIRPHKTHQSGLDVDIAFFPIIKPPTSKLAVWRNVDLERTWVLLRELLIKTDVQVIIADHKVQAALRDYALSIGEDETWVKSLFGYGRPVQHSRGHRDHFHVRFYAARSMEFGRRLAILTKDAPGEKFISHRIRRGDTLGGIAVKYHTSVARLSALNRLTPKSTLSIGHPITVPIYGVCTSCVVPPAFTIPPRPLPPVHPES